MQISDYESVQKICVLKNLNIYIIGKRKEELFKCCITDTYTTILLSYCILIRSDFNSA
jgi:hypothetical protein